MRDPDELDRERADGDQVAGANGLEAVGDVELVLFELRFEERERHGRAVHRAIEEGHQVRHGADVIFVAVREDEGLDLGAAGLDEGHVRNDQIDAELVGIGEHHAGVDEDRRVLPRHRHHVHAELAEASQWDDLERARRHRQYGGLIHSDSSWERLRVLTAIEALAGRNAGCSTRASGSGVRQLGAPGYLAAQRLPRKNYSTARARRAISGTVSVSGRLDGSSPVISIT